MRGKVDHIFFTTAGVLVLSGFFIFISASLGLLARDGARFSAIVFNQAFFGLFLGMGALVLFSKIHYTWWRRYALWIFIFSLGVTALVFVPGLGFMHGGARRWLSLGPLSFQPVEFLKFGFVLYAASILAAYRDKVSLFDRRMLPLLGALAVCGGLLLAQPNTSSFIIVFLSGTALFIIAGGKWRDVGLIVLVVAIAGATLVATRPYVRERVTTFLHPASDPLGAGYQIQQSLIAIGSGGFAGRGFGQSIQKFSFLPEPVGDSIFAVAAEEFGFIGSFLLIVFFVLFAFRGLSIATRAPDRFSGLLVAGIVILIIAQSFMNMASMLGVFPLTGTALLFVSQGGSALFFALAEVGIILSVSKYQKVGTR